MPLPLNTAAAEEGALLITFSSFTDESGATVTPSAVAWTLIDVLGNVVNSRSGVAATPGSSVQILLSGDDLALPTTLRGNKRIIELAYTYDSSLGNGLVGRVRREFTIEPYLSVT